MKKNWVGWLVGLLFLVTLAVIVYEWVQAMTASPAGQSPLAAFQATQQQIFHIMSNQWVFSAYLVLLLALLFGVLRQISRKTTSRNDFWFLAALLVALVSLVRNFLRFR
jgi:hypothetical protein